MTFERRAHANPGQDLDRLAARAFARLTGLNQPVSWATDVRLIGCVGAEPAAFLAKLFAYDVHDWLRGPGDSDAAPGLSAQSARQLLGSLLASGVSRSLDEKLLAARGSRLSARPALLQLTRHRRRPSLVLTL